MAKRIMTPYDCKDGREPMSWQKFAKIMFKLEDADPGYMLLARANIKDDQKKRFMTAWCAFYNPGIAAAASEYHGRYFWDYLRSEYPTAKRASERRHFRGNAGLKAMDSWQTMFPKPEAMVDHMTGSDYFVVAKKAKTVALIGDYFVWKFADVQERVFRLPCAFPDEAAAKSPKVPQQGALLIAPEATVLHTYNRIARYLNDAGMKSPPWYDRPMNMQEAETVCCVYKQYRNGKWCPYSRTAKATRSLLAKPSKTAEEMLSSLHAFTNVGRKEMDQWQQEVLAKLGH
jgi:hypothetical protein